VSAPRPSVHACLALVASLGILFSCGGGAGKDASSSPVTVSLAPQTATLSGGQSQAFQATVAGTSQTDVSWTVDNVSNGNSTTGTISGQGLSVTYTAPNAAGTHTVRVTSGADPGQSDSATVTVTAVAVTVSPKTARVPQGQTQLFKATVTGTTQTGVTWKVDNITNGNATVGSLTAVSGGVSYLAPNSNGSHTLKVTSTADPTKSDTAAITVASDCAPTPTGSVLNVKSAPYNAKGDDTANDTVAIQSAINAAGSGDVVYLPEGIYLVNADPTANSDSVLHLKSNMTFKMDSTTVLRAIRTTSTSYRVLTLTGVSNVNVVGGTILGERLAGDSRAISQEGGVGLHITASSGVVIQGVTVKNCREDGFYVGGASTNITFCSVTSDGNWRHGLGITRVDGLTIRNSVFQNSQGLQEGGVWVCGTGINIEPNLGETVTHVTVTDSLFNHNASVGFAAGPSGANTGKAWVTYITFDGNTVTGNGWDSSHYTEGKGIEITNTSGHSITNNTVDQNFGNGIHLRNHASSNTVTGNTVTDTQASPSAPGYGILLENTSSNSVTGNTLSGNAYCDIRDYQGTGNTVTGNSITHACN
jgi:parallel beta-helix repeat protein